MKHNLWGGLSVLLFILILLPSVGVNAQTPPEYDNVTISLWPEYDEPDTLVMYRAKLSATTQFPAQVTFRIPAYISKMHAVAIATNGQLMSVEPEAILMEPDNGSILLSFPTTSPNVQFEYYDPFILNKENQDRNLTFNFTAPANIAVTNFEVQQPFGAEVFSLIPTPAETITGGDNLQYSNVVQENVAAGETVQVVATYQRNSDALSVESLQNSPASAAPAANISVISNTTENSISDYLGYALVGIGVLLLLSVGGYWLMKNKKQRAHVDTPARRPKQPRRKKRQKSKQKMRQQTGVTMATTSNAGGSGGFCYNCGTALRSDAKFCHSCGAQKRAG